MSKSRYVAGLRAIEQLLASGNTDLKRLLVEYRAVNPRVKAIMEIARDRGIDVQEANRARLRQISGEPRHQGVVAEIGKPTMLDEAGLRNLVENRLTIGDNTLMLLMLDSVQDPHNLGACLRTADAAGVDAVVVPRHGAAGPGPTVSKVAAGAAEKLPFARVANMGRVLDWLADYGVTRIGTSDKAQSSLYDTDLAGHTAMVMGREESGLAPGIADRCDALVCLPMQGSVSSLNVSVATGICLYEALRQRRSTSTTGDSQE